MNQALRKSIQTYGLVVGIGAVIALAYAAPTAGAFLSKYHAVDAAVMAIFLMAGLTTPLEHLGEDLGKWRCHLVIQGFTFAIMPAVLYVTSGWIDEAPVRYGVYLVAVLPTTISSCVVFTTAAGGRAGCAMLNAVGGNLIGIILSPLLLGLLIGRSAAPDFDSTLRAILKLCWLVLLPFVAGRLCGRLLPVVAARTRRIQSYAAQSCILLIMFCAFSTSAGELGEAIGALWRCFLYLAVIHGIIVAAATAASRLFRLLAADAAAVVFCATQKTLAMGIPLAYAFFEGTGVSVALVLLPLVFYHLFQLVFGSLLIPYWAGRTAGRMDRP